MQERSEAERRAIWPCLNVATWRRERSDRAIQQICNLFNCRYLQLSVFGKFVKVICLGLNCRGAQLTLFAFGTQFVLGLNLFWDSIVASPEVKIFRKKMWAIKLEQKLKTTWRSPIRKKTN